MPISDWAALMNSEVTIALVSSRDAYGKPTFAAGATFKARISHQQKWVRMSNGAEQLASGQVWIKGTPTVETEDQITMPDGSTPPILRVDRPRDEAGAIHHVRLTLG